MRRRKLLIGIGAAAAGGSAAFGTEAFTSVQAERNVDVAVAGDRSSFVAIEPLSSDNAGKYVNTESDNTVELELDGDNSGSGEGVTQDAVTQLEDLFRVVNQGSQEVSVYFEDDSDAVTFRVSGSADGLSGTGQSLEGPDNSADLEVGEQVVVGMTINTLNNDVSGQLLDSVVLYADANPSAPQQSVSEPQYVVDGEGNDENTFSDISSALDDAESGSVIGIEGGVTSTEIKNSGTVDVGTTDVTLTGYNGVPTIETGSNQLRATANGVTFENLKIKTPGGGGGGPGFRTVAAIGDQVTFNGLTVTADSDSTAPTVYTEGSDVTVQNCDVTDASISVKSDGSVTVTGNNVDSSPAEGIYSFGSKPENADYTVRNNRVRNSGATTDIKFQLSTRPDDINGQTGNQGQIESLLAENDIFAARVDGSAMSIGTKISSESISSRFTSTQDAVDTAVTTSDGVTLVEAQQTGSYDAFNIPSDGTDAKDGFLLKATGTERPVISGGTTDIFSASAGTRPDDVTVEGLRFEGPSSGPAFRVETGGSADTHDNLTFRDNEFVASDLGVYANNMKSSTFDNNLFTVAQNKTARELLVLGLRSDDSRNGDSVDVTNNDFQTPSSTSLSRSQTSGGNAIEFGPDTGSITNNNFNVDTDEGIKVLIGESSDLSASDVSDNNTGVSSDQVQKN